MPEFVRYSPGLEEPDPNFDAALEAVLDDLKRSVRASPGREGGGAADHSVLPGRFVKNAWLLLRLQATSYRTVKDAPIALSKLDEAIGRASSLDDVFRANVSAMGLAIRTNFAIGGILSGMSRVRRAFGIEGTARVVTEEMMHRYHAIGRVRAFNKKKTMNRS